MAHLKPRTDLTTHEVTNQPPPFEEVNLYQTDAALTEAVRREGGAPHEAKISKLGARAGSAEAIEWAFAANKNLPELKAFDAYGRRIDEVEFHPAYHRLMELGLTHETAAIAWTSAAGGHVAHAALEFLMAECEQGVCCPITMTYASLPALRHEPDLAAVWEPRITAARYDPAVRPAAEKAGVTIGMAMTEKQGGSDLRANTTKATPLGREGPLAAYSLNGHKWFCSAPMCDAFLTLAYTDKGLTCFLAPRWRPDGTRNSIHIMRLKDKLGDRANASSEIEYHDAFAWKVGEEGHGVRTIIEMVQHTRLDCIVAPAAYMRLSVANAIWHTSHRTAFQKRLVDQPLMANVLADLILETEAATALAFRMARAFDEKDTDERAALLARIATPIAKYWTNKRVVNVVYEAMECLGGAGYMEDRVLARLYRQAPVNSIWEGSGNVICLDVLRAMEREPEAVDVLRGELDAARGANIHYDHRLDALSDWFVPGRLSESSARRFVEQAALLLQAGLLLRHAPAPVSDAFCASRLVTGRHLAYGTLPEGADHRALIARAYPQV